MNQPTPALPPEVLQQLKDIHPAPAPGWWPPAPGWWLLAAALAIALYLGWRHWRRWQARRAPWKAARAELAGIRAQWQAGQDQRLLLQQVSELLRRVARHCFAAEIASLPGEQWLQWLDDTLPESQRGFARGPGRILADGLYQARPRVDAEALLQLSEHWLKAAQKRAREADRC